MERNLKFWTRYTWETASVELGMVAVLSALTILSSNGLQWSLFLSTVPYFLVIAAALCIIIINSSTQILYAPLLLSMGETRRNIFLGFCYFRALIIGVTIALCCLIWALAPGKISAIGLGSLVSVLEVLVISSALGSIFGTISVKWKWAGVTLLALVGGVGGGMGGYLFSAGIDLQQADAEKLASSLQTLPWWVGVAAAVLLALDLLFHALLLRRREVKL